jgi:hypothetical protein
MDLAFNLLLTLLVELPIIGFFFRKRKRKAALMVGLLVNLITWPVINIIRLNTEWNLDVVEIGVVVVEGIAYWLFLGRNITKALLITVLANGASYVVTRFVHIGPDFLQKKVNVPIH